MICKLHFNELERDKLIGKSLTTRILSIISTVLIASFIVAVISYIYYKFYDALKVYTNFNQTFLICLGLAVVIISTLYGTVILNKSLFGNLNEKIILGSRPIHRKEVIFSKSVYSLTKIFVFMLVIFYPIIIIFGLKNASALGFYFLGILEIFFLALLTLGFSYFLVIPLNFIKKILKDKPIISIILTLTISVLAALLYSFFLNIFVRLIQDGSIDDLFTEASILKLTSFSNSIFLINNIVNLNLNSSYLYNLTIILAGLFVVLVIGFLLVRVYYAYFFKSSTSTSKQKLPQYKNESVSRALIKKELNLTFKGEEGLFSYFSLVTIQPFLIYLVISSINTMFMTGNFVYIRSLFPAFIVTIDLILILLFINIINSTSSISLKKEKDMILKIKSYPIEPAKQMFIKSIVPSMISSLSLLVSVLVLYFTNEFDLLQMLLVFLIGLTSIFSLSLTSIYADLKAKSSDSMTSIVLDFILPISFVALAAVLITIFKFQYYAYYLIILGLELIVLLSLSIRFRKRINILFLRYKIREGL